MSKAKDTPEAAKTVSVDWGNDSIKFINGSDAPQVVRALFFQVPSYYGAEDLHQATADSPILEKDCRVTHWGESSRLYPTYSASVREDKTSLIKDNIFLCLGSAEGESTVDLRLSVPHLNRFRAANPGFAEELVGTHSFYLNGSPQKVTIKSVSLMPETLGAFRLAQKDGLAGQKLTLVIDLGCGTAIYGLYQPDATPVAVVTKERSGVSRLVDMLRTDPAFGKAVKDTPLAETIQDSLRDMSFIYGVQGIDYSAIVMTLGAQWWRGIVSDALATLGNHRDRIDAVVMTGGGAYLAQKFGYTKAILPQAHLSNVLGMSL